jgi:hypothetical protein
MMLVELWNLAVVEGFVEHSFSGRVNMPVSLTPTGTDFAGHPRMKTG